MLNAYSFRCLIQYHSIKTAFDSSNPISTFPEGIFKFAVLTYFFLQFLTSFHHDLKFLIVTYPACSSVQYYLAPSFQLYRLVRTFVVISLYTYVQIFQAILCNAPMFFSYLYCFFLFF